MLAVLPACAPEGAQDDEPEAPAQNTASAHTSELIALARQAEEDAPEQLLELADASDVPFGAPNTDASQLKIRNGSVIDYDDGIANAVVYVQGPSKFCTAQVINTHFLLTAAHCIRGIFGEAGSADVIVRMNNRNAISSERYRGPAAGIAPSNAFGSDRDIGLIFLWNGLATCQDSLANCAATRPNDPVHAAFQFFVPEQGALTFPEYKIAGYGTVDDSIGKGVGRRGSARLNSATFSEDGIGLKLVTRWESDGESRACSGDSGSPLLVPLDGITRPLHTGVLSTASSCVSADGRNTYTGVTLAQMAWIHGTLMNIRNAFGLPFECPVAGFGNLFLMGCDNDGTMQ